MNSKHLAAAAVTAATLLTGLAGTANAATQAPARAAHTAPARAAHVAPARAAAVNPDGYVTQISCTSMTGAIHFSPGLVTWQRTQTAVVTATLAGCSSAFGGSYADTGSLSAQLTGKASKTAQALSGTFVINWPASSGLNPSVGTLTLNLANGTVTLSGSTSSTAGAFEGSYVSSGYFVTGQTGAGTKRHPITAQTFVNTLPLTVSHNIG